ncbi:MAG TPA: hypothetical protein EYP59_22515 [Thiotrichaceae bacterium]|nr:hypothetical protein [Thiotrichaceae bacterium]
MNIKTPQFEYVFYFLFRTYRPISRQMAEQRWEDPLLDPLLSQSPDVLKGGIRFEEDKRLFRRDVPAGQPLTEWRDYLNQSWLQIVQVYAEAYEDEQKAAQYCQNALVGVTLLILDKGQPSQQHTLTIPVDDSQIDQVQFSQPDASELPIFRLNIKDFHQTAACYRFQPLTSQGRACLKNLSLCFEAEKLPYLAPLQNTESAANPAFLVSFFYYGETVPDANPSAWRTPVENILLGKGLSKHSSLLSTLFTRMMMAQWQFMRIHEAAKDLRNRLQERNRYYADYAHQSNEARAHCARTRLLEQQLQDMHSFNTEAQMVISRIQGASQTIEINADNLATRLEHIRQETLRVNGELDFHAIKAQKIHWPATHEDFPLLTPFKLFIRKLDDHQIYIEQQLKYLAALRDKWQLYLDNRKTQSGEYLNTLVTVLIFLLAGTTGGIVTLNVNKGLMGLNFVDQFYIYLAILILLAPILWRIVTWIAQITCCIFHGTWLNRLICRPIMQWITSLEFFSLFKRSSRKKI